LMMIYPAKKPTEVADPPKSCRLQRPSVHMAAHVHPAPHVPCLQRSALQY
jgi:hypothetical protein